MRHWITRTIRSDGFAIFGYQATSKNEYSVPMDAFEIWTDEQCCKLQIDLYNSREVKLGRDDSNLSHDIAC